MKIIEIHKCSECPLAMVDKCEAVNFCWFRRIQPLIDLHPMCKLKEKGAMKIIEVKKCNECPLAGNKCKLVNAMFFIRHGAPDLHPKCKLKDAPEN